MSSFQFPRPWALKDLRVCLESGIDFLFRHHDMRRVAIDGVSRDLAIRKYVETM